MPANAERAELEYIERTSTLVGGDVRLAVGYLAARQVEIDEAELHAARRRALLVLAAGGDPSREIDFDGVALRRLASELDGPERRERLEAALDAIRDDAADLPTVRRAADVLLADPEFAWRLVALSILVEELAVDD